MALTRKEVDIAIAAVKIFPPGGRYVWGFDGDEKLRNRAEAIRRHRADSAVLLSPAAAVSAIRDEPAPSTAINDCFLACGMQQVEYLIQLHEDPSVIETRFLAYRDKHFPTD